MFLLSVWDSASQKGKWREMPDLEPITTINNLAFIRLFFLAEHLIEYQTEIGRVRFWPGSYTRRFDSYG